jgi:ATP phosphoribosyltransferase
MKNNNQTPVEWFMNQIGEKQPNGLYVIDTLEDVERVFTKAKEMESKKQQKYNEMLEMLNKIIKEHETDTKSWSTILEIKQLIKEATQI